MATVHQNSRMMSSELRTNLLRAIFDRIEFTQEPYLATFCTISAKLGGNVLATT